MYHGKIILPSEYPFKAPHVIFLTPNGRWALDTKVCISFTGFHEESWQPAWGIRTALLGVQALMSSKDDEAGYGAESMNDEGRKMLAEKSMAWTCAICQKTNAEMLPGERAIQSTTTNELPGTPNMTKMERTSLPAKEPSSETKSDAKTAQKDEIHTTYRNQCFMDEKEEEHRPSTQVSEPTPHQPKPAPSDPSAAFQTSSNLPTSISEVLQTRVESYRRTIGMIDTLMGLICAMLFLIVLKNL